MTYATPVPAHATASASMPHPVSAQPITAPGRAPAPSISHALAALVAQLQHDLIPGLQLQPIPVPQELSPVRSIVRAADPDPSTIQTSRWSGASLHSLTIATIQGKEGELRSLTVIGLPPAGSGLPILGIDLIALRGQLSLAALDLAPTHDALWQATCAPLLGQLRAALQDHVTHRRRPAFAADTFSPLALIAAVPPAAEQTFFAAVAQFLQDVQQLYAHAPSATASALALPSHQRPHAADRLVRWLAAERQNRREHNALAHLFGATFAEHYLDRFLFALPGAPADAHTAPRPCSDPHHAQEGNTHA